MGAFDRKRPREYRLRIEGVSMALKHRYTVLCDYVLRGQDGKLALVGTFENVWLREFPGSIPRMFIVVSFTGRPGDKYKIELEGPGQKSIATLTEDELGPAKPSNDFEVSSTTFIVDAQNAPFEKPGMYAIVLRGDKRLVHRLTFGVVKRESREDALNADNQDTTAQVVS